MSYRYDKNKKNKKIGYILGSIFLFLGLFTPIYGILFSSLQSNIVRSWENKQDFYARSSNFFQSFASKGKILEKNKELQKEIERLSVDNLRTRYLSDTLESMLAFDESSLLFGSLLEYGSLGSYDNIVISRGESDNVRVGDVVFIADNVLIGYVYETYSNTSRVRLYSESSSKVNGILYPHGETLTALGNGGGNFIIEAPREIEVTVGDIFYSLSSPGNIIGIVRHVEFDARDPFKRVYLSHPVDIKKYQIVAIKKNLTQFE